MKTALDKIYNEMVERVAYFESKGKLLEAQRIKERTMNDIEMLQETGFCKGIENYSAVMSGRKPGEAPFTLLDYFPKDFLLFCDESHVMLPQVRGMYGGDHSRKASLIEYGFRLPSAFDNRPLTFDEFYSKINQVVFTSATPGEFEKSIPHALLSKSSGPQACLILKSRLSPRMIKWMILFPKSISEPNAAKECLLQPLPKQWQRI